MMASLLSPAVASFPHYSKPSIYFFKTPTSLPCKRNFIKCNSFLDDISQSLLNDSLHLDRFTAFQKLQSAAGEFPEVQKWEILFFSGLAWIYLTARPGVLIGAIDAYIFATLQLGLDSLLGRRNLKKSDFLVGDRLGEGSFGVVYSGLIVPKNIKVDQSVTKRPRAKAVQQKQGFKDKVILKKVCPFILYECMHIHFFHGCVRCSWS